MGLLEFDAWWRVTAGMADVSEGAPGVDDPGSWDDQTSRRNFDELAEKRKQMRGR